MEDTREHGRRLRTVAVVVVGSFGAIVRGACCGITGEMDRRKGKDGDNISPFSVRNKFPSEFPSSSRVAV